MCQEPRPRELDHWVKEIQKESTKDTNSTATKDANGINNNGNGEWNLTGAAGKKQRKVIYIIHSFVHLFVHLLNQPNNGE